MGERLFLHLDGDAAFGPETSAPAGTLRAYLPAAALRNHVAGILLYRENFAAGHEAVERVLPDGAVRLVFNFGEAPTVGTTRGRALEAIGASAAPVLVRLRGRTDGVSVTLRAGAAAALLGIPAGEIGGTTVHLDELWGSAGSALLQRMGEARNDAARVSLLQSELLQRLSHSRGDDAATRRAVQLIAAAGGQCALRDIAAELGIGERRLQQLFHAQVGLSPRRWSRLARLHACLRRLRDQPVPAWADLAVSSGFYDQSHMVNEFRALCGVTPGEYMAQTGSGSSNTPPSR